MFSFHCGGNVKKIIFEGVCFFILTSCILWAAEADDFESFIRGDYARAYPGLLNLAAQGDMAAQYTLGVMHEKGLGVNQDLVMAVKWYRKAGAHGHECAAQNLESIYLSGDEPRFSDEEALSWYLWKANTGNVDAQYYLGEIFYLGLGISRDFAQAATWYSQAAEHDHMKAQYRMGCLALEGRGMVRDPSRAAVWFTRSANRGYAPAQCALGQCYFNGDGVERDPSKALRWFVLSAGQCFRDAQYHLGELYERGVGGTANCTEAYKWYCLAADQGLEAAAAMKKSVELKMTAQQISDGRKLADQWIVRNGPMKKM
jgi:TPR repeat protein